MQAAETIAGAVPLVEAAEVDGRAGVERLLADAEVRTVVDSVDEDDVSYA